MSICLFWNLFTYFHLLIPIILISFRRRLSILLSCILFLLFHHLPSSYFFWVILLNLMLSNCFWVFMLNWLSYVCDFSLWRFVSFWRSRSLLFWWFFTLFRWRLSSLGLLWQIIILLDCDRFTHAHFGFSIFHFLPLLKFWFLGFPYQKFLIIFVSRNLLLNLIWIFLSWFFIISIGFRSVCSFISLGLTYSPSRSTSTSLTSYGSFSMKNSLASRTRHHKHDFCLFKLAWKFLSQIHLEPVD